MVTEIQALGYDYITTKEQLKASNSNKIWGAFAPKALSRELDRKAEQPTLAEMTDKAIQVLSQNPKGFFLMVEGSQVDWAAHANETMGIISEIKAYDDAVGVALKYAKTNSDTLVISLTDHGNSGITIGDQSTSKTYPEHPLEYFTSHRTKATITEEKAGKLLNKKRTNIQEVMGMLGIYDLTQEEIQAIQKTDKTQVEMASILSKRSRIGYTTGGHTGEDVALYVYIKPEQPIVWHCQQ